MLTSIQVRGARQNNLKGVDVDIPHRAMTVLTGPSGSGKSSLAFDTVYAEGQRRYVESLSTYAKQFLERMPKPSVDWIDGVAPSVSIDQRNTVQTSRSTVGTTTETYDHMRLLWSRVGRTVCPECGERVVPDTVQSAAAEILELGDGTSVYVTFPLERSAGLTHEAALQNLRARGYVRVMVDGTAHHVDDLDQEGEPARPEIPRLDTAAEVQVVVDRMSVSEGERERLTDSLASAFAEGHGHAEVLAFAGSAASFSASRRLAFAEGFRCAGCSRAFPDPTPLLFSFNHPTGACRECNGFGATLEYSESLIVPDPGRSLADGALDPWTKPRYYREAAEVMELAGRRELDPTRPWEDLPAAFREELMHGSDQFVGMIPFLRSRERKRYKQYIRVFLRQYQLPETCPACHGARLQPAALNVRVGGLDIASAAAMSVDDLLAWLSGLELSPFETRVSETVLRELTDRLDFMSAVGLGYLSLDRQARTLSGGEMQRIRLAGSLGSRLVDTLYVLDEPTIGLHARDVEQFLAVLQELRDRGNTVLVVEHEAAVMRAADRVLELGPGAGEHGGELVFDGSYDRLLSSGTATATALTEGVGGRRGSREAPESWLRLEGATLHNVRDLDLEIPLQRMTVVTGVSGSGKSTLVHDVLYRALEEVLHGASSARRHLGEPSGTWRSLGGAELIEEAVLVDQSPIGRTPRSNPITYIRAYAEIRRLFAEQPEAKRRGYGPGHFSFNVKGGRCEACKGAGEELVEMVFLADVAMPCEVCEGRRFKSDTLEIQYRGRSIRDVLDLTVDEAIRFFIRRDRLGQALWQLQRVGLGYLRLGQPATTLSGGEAQRLKIARELARRPSKKQRIYILDEPTVGLGLGEIGRLLGVLRDLVESGNTVLMVEHDLDVIEAADWVVDLGPEAADGGGRIVAAGPPREIMATRGSHTGRYLAHHVESAPAGAGKRAG
ncbi:MAG: excinuclease ABC subunit UvrA [marine benthic group bacterium]|nr:excinuclease ABC subunit UvrA [Candidatus Benthicola marisminoris]